MKEKPTYSELMQKVEMLQEKVSILEQQINLKQGENDQAKTRFLGTVSHEIRTPMNAIIGFSNLLLDKNLPEDKREEYVEHISNNSYSLLNIVDSMIDVSLMEINELIIRKEVFNLHRLLQQVSTYFNIDKYKMERDHIALLLNKELRDDEFIIYSDSFRLKQVLSSLLHNALKFTDKGLIEFGYVVDHKKGKLHFFVKDSGRGILFEKAQSIFDKFDKTEDNFGKSDGGVGLGLTLAKGLIKLMGGEIWMEKNVFSGTTFHFTIEYLKEKSSIDQSSMNLQAILV